MFVFFANSVLIAEIKYVPYKYTVQVLTSVFVHVNLAVHLGSVKTEEFLFNILSLTYVLIVLLTKVSGLQCNILASTVFTETHEWTF
jgi:hypothetical protein